MLSILLVSVIIILVFFFYKPAAQGSAIKDCGTNMDCFIDAARNCQKAKTKFTSEVNIFGIEQKTFSNYELKGMQSGKCVFYFITENVELKFSEELVQQMKSGGASQAEIDKQLEESQNLATTHIEGNVPGGENDVIGEQTVVPQIDGQKRRRGE